MASKETAPFRLLALPDACLLAVLQCCATNDQRSVFSAARANSRLHHAAVEALRSVTAGVSTQQQLDSILQYLDKHSCHIDSMDSMDLKNCHDDEWWDAPTFVCQLPASLQVSSLQLNGFILQLPLGNGLQQGQTMLGAAALQQLQPNAYEPLDSSAIEELAADVWQLQPGDTFQGVPEAAAAAAGLQQLQLNEYERHADGVPEGLAASVSKLQPVSMSHRVAFGAAVLPQPLKQLRLRDCELLESTAAERLAAALPQLPSLVHLSLSKLVVAGQPVVFPMIVLQQLQRLTHLELAELELQGPDGEASLALQPLQPSSALQPLQASAGPLQPSLCMP